MMINDDFILEKDLQFLSIILNRLTKRYSSISIKEVKDGACNVAAKIFQTANTLRTVVKDCHDYYVAQTVLRMLADSVTSYIIVYGCENLEEREIRHYLYILDGVRQHKNSLEEKLKSLSVDSSCPTKTLQDLQSQILQSQHLIEECCMCLEQIKKESQWGNVVDVLNKNAYWKFTDLRSVSEEITEKKKTKKNLRKISWECLYERVFDKNIIDFLSSVLSQYAHGLANAYISYEYSTGTETLLCGIASGIMKKFEMTTLNIFKEEIGVTIPFK